METLIKTLFGIILCAIYIVIILVHTWGFWHVYKQPIKNANSSALILRGAMAGLAGWFWLCVAVICLTWKSGGGMLIILWFYGLFFVPVIGIVFTLSVWKLISLLNLNLGLFSRTLFGFIFAATGFAVVIYFENALTPDTHWGNRILMISIMSSMAPFVSIMAGEKRLK